MAHEEFRFNAGVDESPSNEYCGSTQQSKGKVPLSVVLGTQHLKELLLRGTYRILFQPIVSLHDGEPLGYEALARGTHNELSIKPTDLFALAQRCGLAATLSQTLRLRGRARGLPNWWGRGDFFSIYTRRKSTNRRLWNR